MTDQNKQNLSFRPVAVADEPLLSAIYASTRADEMALVTAWTPDQKSAFLHSQFQAQHIHYQHNYPNADFLVILLGEQAAGRLYVDRRPKEIRIVDISLLPDFRGQGFGETILQSLMEEAASLRQPVSIHVERFNRALGLYQRLGFQMLDDSHPIYLLMEWRPLPA